MIALLLNPKTWVALLAAAMIAFVVWTFQENDKLRLENQAQQVTISELQADTKVLKLGQEVVLHDITRLDELAQYKQTVIIREQTLTNELDKIPETEDRPFADGNNLAYARILRDYQSDTLRELATD